MRIENMCGDKDLSLCTFSGIILYLMVPATKNLI